jgi:hypothetical protein
LSQARPQYERRAEVEVKVERRPDVPYLILNLSLNLSPLPALSLLADFFSILLENPCQLRLSAQLPPSGGASIPSLEGWSKYRDAVFSNCRGGQKNCEGYSENVNVSSLDDRRSASSNRLRKKLKKHLRFFLWDRVTPSDRDGGI